MRKIYKVFLICALFFNLNVLIHANDSVKKLIKAISIVESNENPNVVSKDCIYVGFLQISKVVVDDCNRICKIKKYNYDHRYDKDKSIEMFMIMQKYYNPSMDLIKAIRIWNEGPSYNKNIKTTPYLTKIMSEYKKL